MPETETSFRLLIQHARTKQYLTAGLSWTHEEGEAHVFSGSDHAYGLTRCYDLGPVQLVLKQSGREDIVVPVVPSTSDRITRQFTGHLTQWQKPGGDTIYDL